MARIIMLMQRLRRLAVDAEELDQKEGDPLVDLRPYSAVRGVKGVVEIEDPCRHVPKASAQHLIRRQPERYRGNHGRHGLPLDLPATLRLRHDKGMKD